MNRFFIETELTVGSTIQLTESVFHHWVRVLRAQLQEQATLFNGQGGEYLATLSEINKKMRLSPLRILTLQTVMPLLKLF